MGTFLVLYKPGPAWHPQVMQDPVMQQHARFVFEQHRLGSLLLAGPLPQASGAVAVVRAEGLDEVTALLDSDPALAQGLFSADQIRPFQMIVGPEGGSS